MSPEEGPPKKVLRRRSSEEGPLKKVLRRRSSEECPLKKVLRIIRIRSSEEKVLRREGPPKRSPPEEGPSKKVLRRRSSEEARQLRRFQYIYWHSMHLRVCINSMCVCICVCAHRFFCCHGRSLGSFLGILLPKVDLVITPGAKTGVNLLGPVVYMSIAQGAVQLLPLETAPRLLRSSAWQCPSRTVALAPALIVVIINEFIISDLQYLLLPRFSGPSRGSQRTSLAERIP